MKVRKILDDPSVVILLHIQEKDSARHSDLVKLNHSRSTLSLVLRDLEDEGLIERKVVTTRPFRVDYTLTSLGTRVASGFRGIKKELSEN